MVERADQTDYASASSLVRVMESKLFWARSVVGRVRRFATRPPTMRPYLLGELLIVACLLRVYDGIRSHAEVRRPAAMSHGEALLHAERVLRIDIEHSVNAWTASQHWVSLAASYWYQFAHITVTMLVLVWCWWFRPESYRKARNSLVIINVVALAVFLLVPVAPPRLLPGTGFIDTVAQAGFGTSHGGPVTADQYGAMPSLHIGWALWTALVCYHLVKSRPLARCWLVYPFITVAAIVATGNHYLLDAVAGAVLAGSAWWLTHRARSPRATPPLELRPETAGVGG